MGGFVERDRKVKGQIIVPSKYLILAKFFEKKFPINAYNVCVKRE